MASSQPGKHQIEKRKKKQKRHLQEEEEAVERKSKKSKKSTHKEVGTEKASELVLNFDLSAKSELLKEEKVEVSIEESPIRQYTISIAVAGSIVDNAQSLELATVLAGQIARAAAIFRVNEIVVFDDSDAKTAARNRRWSYAGSKEETGGAFLARILTYLETPQYLRRALFPMHPSLRFAGLLPPLDLPHHARKHEWISYREGVVLSKMPEEADRSISRVDVGLDREVVVGEVLPAGTRVTVCMGASWKSVGKTINRVSSSEPRLKAGLYWGYSVRHVSHLSSIFTGCPFAAGYDYRIGTSEHGTKEQASRFAVPKFKHLLVAFGGPPGLEHSKALDKSITAQNVASLFDCYINVCPSQGSRTIRTEEAVLISLQYLQDSIVRAVGGGG